MGQYRDLGNFLFFSNNFIEFHYRILNYVETFSKKPSKTENKLKEKKRVITPKGASTKETIYIGTYAAALIVTSF